MLLAFEDGRAVGFTQLYPSFSSGSAARIFVLNDLYVIPEARRRGVGEALMDAARDCARETKAVRLVLSTRRTNHTAQRLYERKGYVRDEASYYYNHEIAETNDETPRT